MDILQMILVLLSAVGLVAVLVSFAWLCFKQRLDLVFALVVIPFGLIVVLVCIPG